MKSMKPSQSDRQGSQQAKAGKCIISRTLKLGSLKGKSLSVISRYLKMLYGINVSTEFLRERLKKLTTQERMIA